MEPLSSKNYKKEFVNQFPGDDSGTLTPRQTPGVLYSKAKPTPVEQPTLLAWSDELAQVLGIAKPTDQKDIDILGGNHVHRQHVPLRGLLCRAPVRQLGRPVGRRPRHYAGRMGSTRRQDLGAAAKRRRPYPLFPPCRWPCCAALVGARVFDERGHALPGRADHPCPEPGEHRRACAARHVLQRQRGLRARCDRDARGAELPALRQFRDAERPQGSRKPAPAGRLDHQPLLSRISQARTK